METLSRKERRKAERQAKREQSQIEKEKRRRGARIQRLVFYFAGLLLVAGAGYWAYGRWTSGSLGEFVPSLGNRHIGPTEMGLITYNSDPPTSGPHLSSIARWGVSDSPIPKELQVHNLEDGGVIIQYNCSQTNPECRALAEKLAQIVRRYDHAILAPYPGMSHRIVLTAWSRIDKFNEFDEARVVKFIDSYINIDHHKPK